MFKIFFNSKDKGLDYNEFVEVFYEICNIHKKEKKALMFAFLIYDFENPQVSKILNDQDYWLSLNEISSNYLSIFSMHFDDKLKRKITNKEISFSYMHSINTKYTPKKVNDEISSKFFGSKNIKTPSIIFFQTQNDKILGSIVIDIQNEEKEKSFLEIKKYITSVVETLKDIKEENSDNYEQIFNNVKGTIEYVKSHRAIVKYTQKMFLIKDIISFFLG